MEKEKYLNDLEEIKSIMNRSSRFISLSGLSGVAAGTAALIGAYLAYQTVYFRQDYLGYRIAVLDNESLLKLIGIGLGVVAISIISGIYFTRRKAKQMDESTWNQNTKMLLTNFAIPLVTGGIVCLILLLKGLIGLVAPFTLIFYGLALVNASKYTISQVRSLGIMEVILGLIAMYFIGYGLLFWALGFGVLHMVYGVLIQRNSQ